MSGENLALSMKKVCYRYENADRDTVSQVDLEIAAGEFVAVLGRNGSGKSTLGKLMNALFLPAQGTVEVFGRSVTNEDEAYAVREKCGMVFQDPDNQMVATIVEEDVAFGCENLGIAPEEIRSRVAAALQTVGMTQYALSAPHMLSGGQKQRVAIAGVIAMHPDMIVFDESTSMLDPSGRKDIFELAQKLNASGVTVVWITHFMEEAAQCSRVIVVDSGRIAMDGTPREVFSHTEQIERLGLEVPDMTRLASLLRAAGMEVRKDVLTLDEMEVELCRFA